MRTITPEPGRRLAVAGALALALAAGAMAQDRNPGDTAAPADSARPAADTSARADDSATAVPAGSPRSAAPVPSAPAGASLVIPAEGDVFYADSLELVAAFDGPRPASVGVLLDGYPVDAPAKVGEDLVTADLARLGGGVHELTVLLLAGDGSIAQTLHHRFYVRLPEPRRDARPGAFSGHGHIVAKADYRTGDQAGRLRSLAPLSRTGDSASYGITAGTPRAPLARDWDGLAEGAYALRYGQLQADARLALRGEEDDLRQPANRFSAGLRYGPWAGLRAGDVYPAYNAWALDNTRVRGVEGFATLGSGDSRWASLKVVRGESRRAVAPQVDVYAGDSGEVRDTLPGTFAQELTAARLGFGGGPAFDAGVTVLQARDRIPSLDPILNDSLRGLEPADNAVLGEDVRFGFLGGKLQVFGAAATSLYTSDAALGPFDASRSDFPGADQARALRPIFILNATTAGLPYLAHNADHKTDPRGFLASNSAWDAGTALSLPLAGWVSETEIKYLHLGDFFHSEGNPYLGLNPKDGASLSQRVRVWENQLELGAQYGQYLERVDILRQREREFKTELRYIPEPSLPGFWLSAGRMAYAPAGDYPFALRSSLTEAQAGVYYRFRLPQGHLHTSAQYGYSFSRMELGGSGAAADSAPATIPSALGQVINVAAQFQPRFSAFAPRLAYTYAANGIQKPLNTVGMGFGQAWAGDRLRLDLGLNVGQYPKSDTVNDLSLGADADGTWRFQPDRSLRMRGSWARYGARGGLVAGAEYQEYF